MEASGYAAVIADLTGEDVFLTPFPDEAEDPPARFTDGCSKCETPEVNGGRFVRHPAM